MYAVAKEGLVECKCTKRWLLAEAWNKKHTSAGAQPYTRICHTTKGRGWVW